MPKIFTIGFSGKSPDAFMEVLDAVRVRTVWDIRQWRASTYVPFYGGESLSAALGDASSRQISTGRIAIANAVCILVRLPMPK